MRSVHRVIADAERFALPEAARVRPDGERDGDAYAREAPQHQHQIYLTPAVEPHAVLQHEVSARAIRAGREEAVREELSAIKVHIMDTKYCCTALSECL